MSPTLTEKPPPTNPQNKPADAPVGTILVATRGGCWWVRGESDWYWLDTNAGTCTCPHHWYRLKPGDRCKHISLLAAYLAAPD